MPSSIRLKNLSREIDTLRAQFLPNPFDPLGTYPNLTKVQAYTRAFLVLSHAEIESYLEGWAKEIAGACERIWKTKARMTTPLAFLLATHAERVPMPHSLRGRNSKDGPQLLQEASVNLFHKYYKQIKDNHGIKETNFLVLFGPLGISSKAIGATLLPNLDSFGALRGTHAHNSAKAVQSALDPEDEYNRVRDILGDLAVLDQWLVKYKRSIR